MAALVPTRFPLSLGSPLRFYHLRKPKPPFLLISCSRKTLFRFSGTNVLKYSNYFFSDYFNFFLIFEFCSNFFLLFFNNFLIFFNYFNYFLFFLNFFLIFSKFFNFSSGKYSNYFNLFLIILIFS